MTQRKLHIASDLALPLDAVTQTIVVYGGKGMGKSNLGTVFVEELAKNNLRFAVIDPTGVWHGLQSTPDGKRAGIPVLILGGRHGNLPLEPTGGHLVADLVVDHQVNVVMDLAGKGWTHADRTRFVTDYCNRLYERQSETRIPIMLVIDEAGRFVPQQFQGDMAKCVGAVEQLVEWGRAQGVGVMLITQRSARMNKSVSELAEMMIAFRTVGPRSLAAIEDWLGENADKEQRARLLSEIRALPVGRAVVVSPGWLGLEAVVQIRMRETFDSSATPKPGAPVKSPRTRAQIDVEQFKQQMAATLERAAADDPKALRSEISKLKQQLARPVAPQPAAPAKPVPPERIEVPVITDAQIARLANVLGGLAKLNESVQRTAGDLLGEFEAARTDLVRSIEEHHLGNAERQKLRSAHGRPVVAPQVRPVAAPRPAAGQPVRMLSAVAASAPTSSVAETGGLSAGAVKVMSLLAQYSDGVTRAQITITTGYKRSTRDRFIQELSARGFVSVKGATIVPTAEGIQALGPDYEPLPTGRALQDYWLGKLTGGELNVFKAVVAAYPAGLHRNAITDLTTYKRSTRDRFLQRLLALRLVTQQAGGIRASDMLFDEEER